MFKKKSQSKGLRRRVRGEDEKGVEEELEDEEGEHIGTQEISAVQPKPKGPRRPGDGVLGFSSSANKKAKKGEAEDDKALMTSFAFQSNREVQVETDNRATASLQTETEFDRDARALREKYLKRAEEALKSSSGGAAGEKGADSGKVYKGMMGYVDHTAGFRRELTVSGEKGSGAFGPLRASQHIRSSVRFDYQPDICKDYKETGYCGYGDSCKFMHDRGDYKSGWQLEREWDEKQKRKQQALAMGMVGEEGGEEEEEEDDDKDELPFACFICRQPFVDPVVTKCGHYFCEHCALKHNASNKNCFVCNKPTQGVFNTAHEIIKKMKERKAAEAKK